MRIKRSVMKNQSVLVNQSVTKKRSGTGKKDEHTLGLTLSSFVTGLKLAAIKLLKISMAVSGVVLLTFALLSLYQFLLTSELVRLDHIEITGVDNKIRQDLIKMSGLNSELSMFDIKLDDVKQKMEKHPWVRQVELQKRLPHSLVVKAEMETPVAIIVGEDLYYLNKYGDIFKKVCRSDQYNYPIISGASRSEIPEGRSLKKAIQIMAALKEEKGSFPIDELSEVHIKKDGEISLFFKHVAAEIRMTQDDFKSKIRGLNKVAEHLNQTGRIDQVKSIDLNYNDGAIVSFRRS